MRKKIPPPPATRNPAASVWLGPVLRLRSPVCQCSCLRLPWGHLRLRLRFTPAQTSGLKAFTFPLFTRLVAAATYLPEDYLRLRLRFAKPRFSSQPALAGQACLQNRLNELGENFAIEIREW